MITAKLTLPELKTKTVWAGLYGGHYDVIVFFDKKPIKSEFEHNHVKGDWYDVGDNADLVCGSMCLGQFYELFPDADLREYTQQRESTDTLGGRPLEIEIPKVFEIEITTIFDKHDKMDSIQFHEDGW
jgi:hypothetical protein